MPRTPLVLILGADAPTRVLLRSLLDALGADCTEVAPLDALATALPPAETLALVVAQPDPSVPIGPLLTRLRQHGYQGPIIVLASQASDALRQQAFILGVADVVSLPADPTDLRVRLRVLLPTPLPDGE